MNTQNITAIEKNICKVIDQYNLKEGYKKIYIVDGNEKPIIDHNIKIILGKNFSTMEINSILFDSETGQKVTPTICKKNNNMVGQYHILRYEEKPLIKYNNEKAHELRKIEEGIYKVYDKNGDIIEEIKKKDYKFDNTIKNLHYSHYQEFQKKIFGILKRCIPTKNVQLEIFCKRVHPKEKVKGGTNNIITGISDIHIITQEIRNKIDLTLINRKLLS